MHNPHFIDGPHGARLAYARVDGRGPLVVFLGGFRADMSGIKAVYLAQWARRAGRAFLRFDYSGHGASSGDFVDGTISRWTADALAAIDAAGDAHVVLVGSSMGAWIMTRVALARRARVAGMVGIAAAPDFTEDLLWPALSDAQRRTLSREGQIEVPSLYNDVPDVYTEALFADGRACRVLTEAIALDTPVRLIHGTEDGLVPWTQSRRLMDRLTSEDVALTLVKGGDHRLSTPADLERLSSTIETLCEVVS